MELYVETNTYSQQKLLMISISLSLVISQLIFYLVFLKLTFVVAYNIGCQPQVDTEQLFLMRHRGNSYKPQRLNGITAIFSSKVWSLTPLPL